MFRGEQGINYEREFVARARYKIQLTNFQGPCGRSERRVLIRGRVTEKPIIGVMQFNTFPVMGEL